MTLERYSNNNSVILQQYHNNTSTIILRYSKLLKMCTKVDLLKDGCTVGCHLSPLLTHHLDPSCRTLLTIIASLNWSILAKALSYWRPTQIRVNSFIQQRLFCFQYKLTFLYEVLYVLLMLMIIQNRANCFKIKVLV